ncbi:MAG TPA: YetF domain-containing protein [Acidimicrobiales bacterium]
MFFDDLADVGRVVALGGLSYLVLVAVLRLSGKRTLAKLNAFDLVVTVAFGSVLATTLLSPTTSLAESTAAFATLAIAQYAVAKGSVLKPSVGRAVRAEPTALVVDGHVRQEALEAERVTPADVRTALRQSGVARTEDAAAVVLETDGSISVVRSTDGDPTALADVAGLRSGRPDGRAGDGRSGAGPAGQDRGRSTEDVVSDHLRSRLAGDLEGDLARNYHPGVVLLSAEGVHRGHDGVRTLAGILRSHVPAGGYDYGEILCEGDVGLLQWTAGGDEAEVHDGADSYVVRDGRIVAQTIHYSTRRAAGDPG